MKRSEMLKIIEYIIDNSDNIYMEDYGISNNIQSDKLADEILKKIEQAGMLPPSYYKNKDSRGFMLSNPDDVNEWEPEND